MARRSRAAPSCSPSCATDEVAIATTPKDEVWRQDKVTLHHYRPLADTKIATPVLIVYGLIGRYTMADLQEDRSLVRNLLNLGVDLYVVDWGNPSRADRWLTLDDYIDGYLAECVRVISERHRIDKVSLLGICEGGVFTTCYAALHPDTVKAMVLTITPIDFHGDTVENRLGHGFINIWTRSLTAGGYRSSDRGLRQSAGRVHGVCFLPDDAHAHPDEVQSRHVGGHGRREEVPELPAHGEVDRRSPASSRRGRQAVAQGPLPGQQAHQERFHASAAGRWTSATSPCRCSTCSPKTITSFRPPPRRHWARRSARRTTPSSPLPGGHVGVFVGGKSQALLGSGIANWLSERQ